MTALKHKERWSLSSSTGLDVFYGSQIETYLRQHAADLEPGRPVPYGEIPASCFFLSVNFYQYSYELCSADGSPLEFRISTTHVFKKDSPERYAEAKAKLLKNHRHPWFKLLNGICRMPETDRELFRDFSVKDVNRMACWVWERVAGQDKSFRAYAFSVIMTLLEGRLAIESLVARARNGMLPERLKPASFVFNELKPNIKQLLAESSLIKTTPVMRSRFKNPTGVTHCFPLFKQAVGTLACVAPHDPEVLKHRPAYFVLQTSNGWKLYFSDIRDDKPEFVAFGKGRIENFEKKICDKAKAHLLEILLHQTGKTFALQNLGQERFFDVRPVTTSDVTTIAVYEDMLARYKESIAKLLTPPHGRRIRDKKEKENFEKMYAAMHEAFEFFSEQSDKSLRSRHD